ncbi:indolepyruvate oxidoreductase, partial [Candidatus Amesbacteria bacterium RIFOXYD1_FULL_47_9]
KQAEVHGMAQRGGAVVSNLRLSDKAIQSDLILEGTASLILSMEPLESLRYLKYLSKDGTLVTSTDPFVNIPDYPDLNTLLKDIKSIPNAVLVDSKKLALEAGNAKATNTVMLGAVSSLLPMKPETLREVIGKMFKRKGEQVVELNMLAFDKGREVSK